MVDMWQNANHLECFLMTFIGFANFFRCLIFQFFFFTNADVTIKDLNKMRETNGGKIKEQDSLKGSD